MVLSDGAVIGSVNPLSNTMPTRNGLKRYIVKRGDTFSSIAKEFSVTPETIKLANTGLKSQLKLGQELTILPVSGIIYSVKDGDSLDLIANLYKVDPDLIKQFNINYQQILSSGNSTLILPYAKPIAKSTLSNYADTLPDLKGYFVLPAIGWNWGELHEYNAVDIANQCGAPIYASAEGLVVPDDVLGDGLDGWNNGYGLFVLLKHPNGTETRYGHLGKVTVRPGDFISQGEQLGLMGNSGNTHGPTGCHLHFEVIGAKNPFALK